MTEPTSPRPRVVLLTSPGLQGAYIINTLAREAGIDVVGVGLTGRIYKGKGLLAGAKTFLKRTGFRYTSYGFWTTDFTWGMLRLTGRPRGLKGLGKNVRLLKDVNSPETVAWLNELQPDYVASFFFNQWIGADVRKTARIACINLHPSLLPALRGPDPIFRTLERGLTQTGLTLHVVADGLDAGDILYQAPQAVPPDSSVLSFYAVQVKAGAKVLAEWMAGKLQGTAIPQLASEQEDYTTFPTPAEVASFVRSGKRLMSYKELFRAISEIE